MNLDSHGPDLAAELGVGDPNVEKRKDYGVLVGEPLSGAIQNLAEGQPVDPRGGIRLRHGGYPFHETLDCSCVGTAAPFPTSGDGGT